MQKSTRARIAASAAALAVSGGLAVAASGTTGAYFSDTHSGTITGTIGSIKVATAGGSGADHLDLQFNNLLPGEKQTVTTNYRNTGNSAEDVWVVFNNGDALHALNDLGSYGEVHMAKNGSEFFASKNLNDKYPCGTVSAGYPTICPVAPMYKIGSSVAPNGTGTFDFTFNYSSAISTQRDGAAWNFYPVNTTDHNGLPYQIVATQVGQTPGA